jgi:hypothetical protein
MKEGLNLLPSMAKFQAARINLRKKIMLFMGIFLGAWIFFVVIVFGWLGVNNVLLNKAKRENTLTLDQYKSLVSNVVLSKKNKYQAKIVGKVLSERFEYGASIEKITNIFPDNSVIIEDFKIKNKKQFVLNGKIDNGVNMIKVEEKIKDINLGYEVDFKSAKLNNISIKDNYWNFEMEIDLI